MENIALEAQERTILGKKVKKIRNNGQIPAILYGHGIENQPLTLNLSVFNHVFKKAGVSSLVNLKIDDGKPFKVLFHEPSRDPRTNIITHVDIYKVKMSEKIKTEIPLEFINEAPAVTELEGNLIISKDAVEVECLPDALVPNIEVDLSTLATFDDNIHVSDINVPEKMEILDDPEELVATVSAPRSEEELAEDLAETTAEEEQAAVAELAENPEEAEATEGTEEKSE